VINQVPPGAENAIRILAASIPTVRRVYLLGSRIKGTAAEASDLDIAFEMSGADEGERFAEYMLDVANREEWRWFEQRFGCRMGHTPFEDVRAGVLEHGRIIYEAEG
jgi:predicted nucleotidyltransferase